MKMTVCVEINYKENENEIEKKKKMEKCVRKNEFSFLCDKMNKIFLHAKYHKNVSFKTKILNIL